MRLINVETFRLHEFVGENNIPPYAVLSHTWGDEELSYLDFLFLTSDLPVAANTIVQALLRAPSTAGKGFRKVKACCDLAQSRGTGWVWIDTCCIDKSSSAELSEAINSMWRWYRAAAECYVYLYDVPASDTWTIEGGPEFAELGQARWFSRGWTLQELLAPNIVLFCNCEWQVFAEKHQIAAELESITNIPTVFLDGTYDPSNCEISSVAMKMSWLSRRETTRIEDMAYCMLGLFDVHMPLLYGEGRKAFMRLQLEVIKKIADDSIFAWTADTPSAGLLASWPTAFVGSGDIVQLVFPDDETPWLPPTMTPIGLEMRARYPRNDPNQRQIDIEHNVQTISIALYIHHEDAMVMHCTRCTQGDIPITKHLGSSDVASGLVIHLRRSGSTWQRVNCRQLDFQDYVNEPSPMDAYALYYVEQQGL